MLVVNYIMFENNGFKCEYLLGYVHLPIIHLIYQGPSEFK